MRAAEDRIREIEEEIRRTPYNKATQKHIGRLKARLARLRENARPSGGGRQEAGLRKSGDATVALVGFPSVGKSTLLNRITEADSRVGDYDFTTLRAVPGVLSHRGAHIQVLDLPGVTEGAARGRGRGREVLSQVRIADLLLLMIDVERRRLDRLLEELREGGIRVTEEPPRVSVEPRDRGGVTVTFAVPQRELDEETVQAVAREWGVLNAEIVVREDLTLDRLVDHLASNRVYVPALVILNKVDLVSSEELDRIRGGLAGWEVVPVAAREGRGLDRLIETIYNRLAFIRVYLRPPGQRKASEEPLILKEGAAVADVCRVLHGDFLERFRTAQVWGPSAKFPGQRVGLDHVLQDGDTITIGTRVA